MNTFDIEKATERMIAALKSHHLNIRPEFLQPGPQHTFFDLSRLQRTPLFNLVLNHFDTNTCQWYERINDTTYSPDWHVVKIDPDVSPLDADDWRMVAPSLTTALASVLIAITDARIKPVQTERADNSIVIHGEEGPLAAIERISFERVTEPDRRRAVTALKGVRRWGGQTELERGLSRLQGYKRFAPLRNSSTGNDEKGEHLFIDASNLCTTMKRLLSKVVEENVSRHMAQEILSTFFGLPSWQHFVSKVNSRQTAAEEPHMLFMRDRNQGDYLTVAYARDLPESVYLFGQWLRKQERSTCRCSGGTRIHLCNFTETDRETFLRTGSMYVESRGVELRKMREVYPDQDMCYLAASLLDDSNLSDAINQYFFAGLSPQDRLIELNVRAGASRDDQVIIGEWIYYVNKAHEEGLFFAEPISPRSRDFQLISSALHKSALIKVEGAYWLSTDWDRKPEHQLPGLEAEGARLISRKLGIKLIG